MGGGRRWAQSYDQDLTPTEKRPVIPIGELTGEAPTVNSAISKTQHGQLRFNSNFGGGIKRLLVTLKISFGKQEYSN